MNTLTEKDIQVLSALERATSKCGAAWASPLQIGSAEIKWLSHWLSKLARNELVSRKRPGGDVVDDGYSEPGAERGRWVYQITEQGRLALIGTKPEHSPINNLFGQAGLVRFEDKYIPEPTTGCHIWLGCLHRDGYGFFRSKKGNFYAHRAAYLMKHGAIPAGMEIDHLCSTPCCVNPDHLEAVTASENTRRMWARNGRSGARYGVLNV